MKWLLMISKLDENQREKEAAKALEILKKIKKDGE